MGRKLTWTKPLWHKPRQNCWLSTCQ